MKSSDRLLKRIILMLIIAIVALGSYKVYDAQSDKGTSSDVSDEDIDIIDVDDVNYKDYKNYRKKNLERYKKYHSQHQDLSADEVIWRVNCSLDKDFYDDVKSIKEPNKQTVVVNKYYKLNKKYVPNDLVKLKNGVEISRKMESSFKELLDEAKKAGHTLEAVEGYISYNVQEKTYDKLLNEMEREEVDLIVARPGHSEHQTGLAVDLIPAKYETIDEVIEAEDFEFYEWLNENAHRFGFIQSYKENAEDVTGYTANIFHWRYIGEEQAIDMKENSIRTLDEYLDKGGLRK